VPKKNKTKRLSTRAQLMGFEFGFSGISFNFFRLLFCLFWPCEWLAKGRTPQGGRNFVCHWLLHVGWPINAQSPKNQERWTPRGFPFWSPGPGPHTRPLSNPRSHNGAHQISIHIQFWWLVWLAFAAFGQFHFYVCSHQLNAFPICSIV